MYLYVYICMCIYIYIYVYVYVCIYAIICIMTFEQAAKTLGLLDDEVLHGPSTIIRWTVRRWTLEHLESPFTDI